MYLFPTNIDCNTAFVPRTSVIAICDFPRIIKMLSRVRLVWIFFYYFFIAIESGSIIKVLPIIDIV